MGAAANLVCGRDEELCTVTLSRTAYSRWEVRVVSVKDPDIINFHRVLSAFVCIRCALSTECTPDLALNPLLKM